VEQEAALAGQLPDGLRLDAALGGPEFT